MRRGTWLALGAVMAALVAPAVARADIFAAVDTRGPTRDDVDVAVLNASTGARVPLPAGTNTPAAELHPSISADGRRLTFLRSERDAGTTRIVVVDLATGQSSDLFSGFEVAQRTPTEPAISPAGDTVYTGGLFESVRSSFFASVTATSLAPFPAGPYTHASMRPQYGFTLDGTTEDVAAGGSFVAYAEHRFGSRGELILQDLDGKATSPETRSDTTYSNPNLAATNPTLVVFQQRINPPGVVGDGDIVFRPASISSFVGTPTVLPGIVNSTLDESQPALTADERYLAFVRHETDRHDRLFVWDTQTQLLLNDDGVDLGDIYTAGVGAVSLYTKALFKLAVINAQGLLTVNLTGPSGVGIVVQRILGRHRVLGRQAYKLGPARRVPLGQFKKGSHAIHWDLDVNGRKLAPGRYLVTPRAVTPKVVVRELGRPRVIHVR